MKVLTYDQMKIEIIQITPNYEEILSMACSMTMKKEISSQMMSERLLDFLISSGHTSLLEHLIVTVKTTGVSRSFLAQITRHRHMSPTSASQHYQDYSDWPIVLSPSITNHQGMELVEACNKAFTAYRNLILTVPKEEARQVLPNAAAVNLLMTWNARSLLNLFEQRCCNRNVEEMRIFSNKFRALLMMRWPLLIAASGPQCHTNLCRQGHMRCKEKKWKQI